MPVPKVSWFRTELSTEHHLDLILHLLVVLYGVGAPRRGCSRPKPQGVPEEACGCPCMFVCRAQCFSKSHYSDDLVCGARPVSSVFVCSWLVGLDGVRVPPLFVYSFEPREVARHVLNCGAKTRKAKTYDTRNSRYHLRGGAASDKLSPQSLPPIIGQS